MHILTIHCILYLYTNYKHIRLTLINIPVFKHDHIRRAAPFTAEEGVPGLGLEAEVTILTKTYEHTV